MTKQWIRMATLAGAFLCAPFAMAADPSGNWIATVPGQGEPQYAHVVLHVDGDKLTGTWGASTVTGTVSGDTLTLALTNADGKPAGSLTGSSNGEIITGTGKLAIGTRRPGMGARASDDTFNDVTFKLEHAPVLPPSPRSIKFEPEQFYSYYTANLQPALHIFPGDVVHTWTADAGGVDAKGIRHRGGDSNIGPFYVEGALPGDTLVVHLLKVRTNRSTARQGTHINPNGISAAWLTNAKVDPEVDGQWTLLPDKGIAVPTNPSTHMKHYSVPLKPMLGCISVAPQGDEQFRGNDLGPFGGNMDYNDNVEGTTLYFPVFHRGALLGMGDGHAAMGDGEVTGSALETSLDVDFSVEVIPGDATAQVRAETKDYLIAFGVTGSVPESIQVATSELATWIKHKYKLSDSEVAILLASTLKYDITELVDPRFNVVAKVPKSILATMK